MFSRSLLLTALVAALLAAFSLAVPSGPTPAEAANVAGVSAGGEHTCAVTTGGGVKCWGDNNYGQLGDGNSPTDGTTPVAVTGLTFGVATVSAGEFHTCALTTGGGVKCWGLNFSGALGDDTTTTSDTPVDVCAAAGCASTLSGVDALSVGGFHTCALTATGGVKCWGSNGSGQLGDDSATSSDTPVDVCAAAGCASNLSGIDDVVSAGGDHTCALTTGGDIKCWGDNFNGQLGNGNSPTDSDTPVNVTGLASGVAAVSAGDDHTCAVTSTGGVKCWGSNTQGQLGNGTVGFGSDTPVDVDSAVKTAPPKLAWPGDTDGDGCPDVNENQDKTEFVNGGGRDYLDPYDWYSVNNDNVIDLLVDILGVIQHYAPGGDPPYDATYVPFDRGPTTGPNPWNMTAPDGKIDLLVDILGVIQQYSPGGCTNPA